MIIGWPGWDQDGEWVRYSAHSITKLVTPLPPWEALRAVHCWELFTAADEGWLHLSVLLSQVPYHAMPKPLQSLPNHVMPYQSISFEPRFKVARHVSSKEKYSNKFKN